MPRNEKMKWKLCQIEGIGSTAGRRRKPGSRGSGRAEQHQSGTPVVGKVSNPHTGVESETILLRTEAGEWEWQAHTQLQGAAESQMHHSLAKEQLCLVRSLLVAYSSWNSAISYISPVFHQETCKESSIIVTSSVCAAEHRLIGKMCKPSTSGDKPERPQSILTLC